MELGEHEPNEPPVADCDCRRCAVATRDALRKDAERYRWLREHFRFANDSMRELWFDPVLEPNDSGVPDDLDQEIDHAMSGANHLITTAHWQKLLWVSASETASARRRKVKSESGEKIANYLNNIYPCWGRITDFYQFLDIKQTKVKDGGRTTLRRELFILIEQKKIEAEIKKTKTGRYRRYRFLK